MPLSPWIPAVEKMAAVRIGDPVTIGALHYALFPAPTLTLEGITIGRQQDIKVPSAAAAIGIVDLISEEKSVSHIELQAPVIDQDALRRLLKWTKPPAQTQRLTVEQVSARGARVALSGMEPLTVNMEARLGANGTVTRASFRLADGTLSAEIVPKGDNTASLSARATRFTPPLGPKYVFESVELTATLTPNDMRDVRAEGTLFGGKLKATGQARYAPDIVVEGRFEIENMNLEPLVALFAKEVSVTGGANMNGVFTLQAPSVDKLLQQARVDLGFSAHKGIINNVDLVRAAQSSGREGIRGGRTRYTNITGLIAVTSSRASFQQLRISSDSLNAAGGFDVLPKGEVAGTLGIQVGPRGTVVAQGNIVVSGDVRNPVLR
jgi:hypothetical protein